MVGNDCPLVTGALGLKAICNTPVAFSQMYLDDVEFVNYQNSYDQSDFPTLENATTCSKNRVFRTNSNAAES